MRNRRSRRSFLRQSAALAVAALSPRISFADAAPPTAMSAELVAAAQKEGKVVWYASVDLPVAEKVARGFEAKYPGISVRVERNGSEPTKEATMASWLKCTARRGGGAIHVNLENAVSVYWSERDKATVIAFIGGEKDAVLVEEKPDQVLGSK